MKDGSGRRRRLASPERLAEHRRRRIVGFNPQRRRVGIGYSAARRPSTVADGTEMMAKRIERVLDYRSGMGIVRHVDADTTRRRSSRGRRGVKVPMKG